MTPEGRGISSELNTVPGLIVWEEAEEVILFHLAGSSSTSIFYMEKKKSQVSKNRVDHKIHTCVPILQLWKLSVSTQFMSNPPLIILSHKLLISKYFTK